MATAPSQGASAAADTNKLRDRLQKLPQELVSTNYQPPRCSDMHKLTSLQYDIIYDMTFTAEPGGRKITSKLDQRHLFAFPDSITLLHVDRASRAMFASSFFATGTFTANSIRAQKLFLRAVAHEHARLIKSMNIPLESGVSLRRAARETRCRGPTPRG